MIIPSFGCNSVDPVVLIPVTVSSVVVDLVGPADVPSSSSTVFVELVEGLVEINVKDYYLIEVSFKPPFKNLGTRQGITGDALIIICDLILQF